MVATLSPLRQADSDQRIGDEVWELEGGLGIRGKSPGVAARRCCERIRRGAALGLALPGGLIGPVVTALLSNGSAVAASLNGIRPLLRNR